MSAFKTGEVEQLALKLLLVGGYSLIVAGVVLEITNQENITSALLERMQNPLFIAELAVSFFFGGSLTLVLTLTASSRVSDHFFFSFEEVSYAAAQAHDPTPWTPFKLPELSMTADGQNGDPNHGGSKAILPKSDVKLSHNV